MSDQEKRCDFCWHPPRHVESHEGLHNEGCPMINAANTNEWERGRTYGFNDNYIEAWRYRFYTPAFILGWRVGKEEIDNLVDNARGIAC